MVQKLLHDRRQARFALTELPSCCSSVLLLCRQQPSTDKVDGFLATNDIPNTVTCHDNELVARFTLEGPHIWSGHDELVTRGQRLVLLVLQVANGARKTQVPVDAVDRQVAKTFDLHPTASPLDAATLTGQVGLVVFGEVQRPPTTTQDRAAVPSVGHHHRI